MLELPSATCRKLLAIVLNLVVFRRMQARPAGASSILETGNRATLLLLYNTN
jgi:hypothetical protein